MRKEIRIRIQSAAMRRARHRAWDGTKYRTKNFVAFRVHERIVTIKFISSRSHDDNLWAVTLEVLPSGIVA